MSGFSVPVPCKKHVTLASERYIRLNFCIYKAWILVYTKPLYSNVKLIHFGETHSFCMILV